MGSRIPARSSTRAASACLQAPGRALGDLVRWCRRDAPRRPRSRGHLRSGHREFLIPDVARWTDCFLHARAADALAVIAPAAPQRRRAGAWSLSDQSAAIGQQLTVDVAVDQDRPELGGAGQQVRPCRGTSGRPGRSAASAAASALIAGSSPPPQPAMSSGAEVPRRTRLGQRRRLGLMPVGNDRSQRAGPACSARSRSAPAGSGPPRRPLRTALPARTPAPQ